MLFAAGLRVGFVRGARGRAVETPEYAANGVSRLVVRDGGGGERAERDGRLPLSALSQHLASTSRLRWRGYGVIHAWQVTWSGLLLIWIPDNEVYPYAFRQG